MKVAKVVHYRCDDYSATTYVWIPDDMTNDEFIANVRHAEIDYLAFVEEFSKVDKVKDPGWSPDYKKFPDKTVTQIDAEHAVLKKEYSEWKTKETQAYKSFEYYLRKYGCIPLWEYEGCIETTVDWGHRHGQTIDYENTYDDERMQDFPGPLKVSRF